MCTEKFLNQIYETLENVRTKGRKYNIFTPNGLFS